MTKTQAWLSGLLAVQLLLAAILYWQNQQPQLHMQQHALLDFTENTVNRIVISDAEHSVTLNKSGDTWQLPGLDGLPGDALKIDAILSKLSSLTSGWPVATTAGSHERFEVANNKFQRRVQLYQGETLAGELLLGTSPGFRKTHIRSPGDDAVYLVNLNVFEFPVKADDWLDKALLAAKNVEHIKGPDYALEKKDDQWQLITPAAKPAPADQSAATLNQEKAVQLASALSSLRIMGLADKPATADETTNKTEAKLIHLEVSNATKKWQYQFRQAGDNYMVKRDDRDKEFTLSKFDFDRIAGIGMSQLTTPDAPETQESGEDDQSSPANNPVVPAQTSPPQEKNALPDQ